MGGRAGGQPASADLLLSTSPCLTSRRTCPRVLQDSAGTVKPAEIVPCSSAGTTGTPDGSCYSTLTRSGVLFTLQQAGKGVSLSTAQSYTCPVPGWMGVC